MSTDREDDVSASNCCVVEREEEECRDKRVDARPQSYTSTAQSLSKKDDLSRAREEGLLGLGRSLATTVARLSICLPIHTLGGH